MPRYILFLLLFACTLHAAPPQKKTICLNMIVKNESSVIERCLASVKPLIDYWVIVDTGSSDSSQQMIQNFLQDVPGELYESPWVDFAHNRNEALALAKNKADYILFIDADERLVFSDSFAMPQLDKDCYAASVREASGLVYQRPLLINGALNWEWKGVLHECVMSPQARSVELLQGVVNESHTADGARSKNPDKYLLDAQVLEEALAKEPSNCRYAFYLAQSYINANEYASALKAYQKRASMRGGEDHEMFWSLYCIAKIQKILNEPEDLAIESLWKAVQSFPSRAEPLIDLVDCAMAKSNYALGYILSKHACSLQIPATAGFVDLSVYDYIRWIRLADCAYLAGKYDEASQTLEALLANPRLPEEERALLAGNLSIARAAQKKPRVSIITSVWNGDLFIEGFLADITQQTIFNQCELILINANSPGSEEAVIRRYMEKYPNIIYEKLPADPGLYAVWNRAIRRASAPLIANANLDDRSRFDCLEKQAEAMEADPTIDLVYSAHYLTDFPNETFLHNRNRGGTNPPEFSQKNMFFCLPGARPMWRKNLHDRYGLFSELFFNAGDYEMWLRAVSMGAEFKKIPGILYLVYVNPEGISTSSKKDHQRRIELELIAAKYSYLYGGSPPDLPPPPVPEGG